MSTPQKNPPVAKPVVNASAGGNIEAGQGANDEAMQRMQRQIDDLNRLLAIEQLRNAPSEIDTQNRHTLQRTASTEQRAKDAEGKPMTEKVEWHDKAGKVIKTEDVELWDMRIQLAPTGSPDGLYIRSGDTQYIDGVTYRMNTYTLRSVKEIIARGWTHEDDIHGKARNRPHENRAYFR